jgi:hypothetical protein
MKKLSVLAIAALALTFASCKKDRTCTCTTTSSSGTTVKKTVYYKIKKGDALEKCQGSQTTTESGGVSVTGDPTTCELK